MPRSSSPFEPRSTSDDVFGRDRTVFGTKEGIEADVQWLGPTDPERLGYQTQKPMGLLERIIRSSCPDTGLVLDPFCGCGTTIAVAEMLKTRWIGIDVTHLAISLIKHRLADMFGGKATYKVVGEPVSLPDARVLAKGDPYQFQWWVLGLVNARPMEQKKGADKGIDGRLYFHDAMDARTTKPQQIIFSVKAGKVQVSHVRDLRGVLEREKAAIGGFLSLKSPTQPMRKEAAAAGFYRSPWTKKDYPKIQLRTVKELLDGKRIEYPPLDMTFAKALQPRPTPTDTMDLEF